MSSSLNLVYNEHACGDCSCGYIVSGQGFLGALVSSLSFWDSTVMKSLVSDLGDVQRRSFDSKAVSPENEDEPFSTCCILGLKLPTDWVGCASDLRWQKTFQDHGLF